MEGRPMGWMLPSVGLKPIVRAGFASGGDLDPSPGWSKISTCSCHSKRGAVALVPAPMGPQAPPSGVGCRSAPSDALLFYCEVSCLLPQLRRWCYPAVVVHGTARVPRNKDGSC